MFLKRDWKEKRTALVSRMLLCAEDSVSDHGPETSSSREVKAPQPLELLSVVIIISGEKGVNGLGGRSLGHEIHQFKSLRANVDGETFFIPGKF